MRNDGKPNYRADQASSGLGVVPSNEDPTDQAMQMLGGATGMTRTQTQYQTAVHVQVKRDIKKVEQEICYEAGMMGEDFLWGWDVFDKTANNGAGGMVRIEGVSIDGAMSIMRNWGNTVCETDIVAETPTHFVIKATFIDLEKGFSLPRPYRQRKSAAKVGKMNQDRAEDMSLQIGVSKAQRNVILKATPAWLIDRATEAAKSQAAEKYKNVEEHAPKVIAYAKGLDVSLKQLEDRTGKPVVGWTPHDIVYLRSVFKAIADRQTTVFDAFPPIESSQRQESEQKKPEVIDVVGTVVPDPPKQAAPAAPAVEPEPAQKPPVEPAVAAEPPKQEPPRERKKEAPKAVEFVAPVPIVKPTRDPGEEG